jgi:hypothetical protein
VFVVLRIIGIFNAAIWLGSTVFFTFGVARGVFSPEMEKVLTREYMGYVGQVLIGRYFTVSLVCCLIAIGHFFAEMVYAGKRFRRLTFGLLIGMLALGMLGNYVFRPRIKVLHHEKYRGTAEQRLHAEQQLPRLHAVSVSANLLVLAALFFYTWQVTNPSDPMRFVGTSKFRG